MATIPAGFWWGGGALVVLWLITSIVALCAHRQVKRQQRHHEETEARLNTILDGVDACIYIKTPQLRYTYVNRKLAEVFGRPGSDILGTTDAAHLPHPIVEQFRRNDLRVLQHGVRVVSEEEIPRPDGSGNAVFISIKIPLRDASGAVTAICGISTDISELRESRSAIHRLAYYDALTELPNRRLLQQRMEDALLRFQESGTIAALLFLDLDNFKIVNDERGHETGDAILREVAQRLMLIANGHGLVARLGGDEFVILLTDLGSDEDSATRQALHYAEVVRVTLEEPVTSNGLLFFTEASIGVTIIGPNTASVADALREADTAMYSSKEHGRNRVALYNPSMHAAVAEQAALLRDLVVAIEERQFELAVQPQYDRAGKVIGAEVLLRWHHPSRGVIMPEKFIPLAEETEYMLEIGEWVLEQACHLHAQLTALGCPHPLSVNVSPVQLRHPRFHGWLQSLLHSTGTSPANIILELTEGVLAKDVDDTAKRMQALADMGLKFSIDDFGTGYSSLAYLHRLPIYEVKIARDFVQRLPEKDAGTLIRLIAAAARLLELRIIAEGIETPEQAAFLDAVGCDGQQGYFHQGPVPASRWLEIVSGKATGTGLSQPDETS